MKFMKLLEFFNRYLERQVLHFIAICVICIVVIAVIFRCVSPDKWNNSKSLSLGSDFAHFFVAGKILNEHGYLYDPNLRAEIWRQVKSVESENPPFLYAPFFALPFRALAMLGFTGSYLCWLPILVILYGSGLVLVLKTTKIPGRDYVTVILLAFSFGPFIMNCFLFGHVSPFGFFAISLAYYFYHNKKDFLSGMALALCLYKPNFLIFILPLLIISQKKNLLNFGMLQFLRKILIEKQKQVNLLKYLVIIIYLLEIVIGGLACYSLFSWWLPLSFCLCF